MSEASIDKLFVATKAFIERDGKVLVVRESVNYQDGTNAGKFDVPGGRLSAGEHFDEALRREVKEETGLTATVHEPIYVGEWRPTVRGENWQIVGIFFRVSCDASDVLLSDDHMEFLWIDPKDYKNHPIIENLARAFEAYLAARS